MAVERRAPDPPAEDNHLHQVIHPNIDHHEGEHRTRSRESQWDILAAIAGGGVVGAESRYGVGLLLPHQPGQFAWSTVVINASGCLLIGGLMVILLELTEPHRLVRPFLGVGILGGYTTFSTFAMDAQELILAHRPGTAALYVALTLSSGALAVWAATVVTRGLARMPAVPWSGRRREGKH